MIREDLMYRVVLRGYEIVLSDHTLDTTQLPAGSYYLLVGRLPVDAPNFADWDDFGIIMNHSWFILGDIPVYFAILSRFYSRGDTECATST